MTHTLILYFICVCIFVMLCALGAWVFENRGNIERNLTYIKQNKELIEQNTNLIHLINVMLSNSELKVEWNHYAERLKELGIDIQDPHRNQDLYDPEG